MNKPRFFTTILFVLFVSFNVTVLGQSNNDRDLASVSGAGSVVRWDVSAPHSAATLTVSGPDGQIFTTEFPAGRAPEFRLAQAKSERLPDGVYTYELRLTPVLAAGVKEALTDARIKGNGDEVQRDLRRRGMLPAQSLVQSGSFSVLNGVVTVAGAAQEASQVRAAAEPQPQPAVSAGPLNPKVVRHHPVFRFFDQVIPDDLIVQGSGCFGIDCVNNENFGFDTIRVKENNTRIQFDDTSTSAGFATNNWQIRANSSASGGASFLAFVDQGATGNSETGTIILEVDAGAPANSLFVSSAGRLGLKTATPVLDVHANNNNTPAIRLEQNNSGGFTAQTWDIGANEANFFVRDVTGGSRLPFRIRPGAPTSSVDIAADGNVGIGIGAPRSPLHVNGASAGYASIGNILITDSADNNRNLRFGYDASIESGWIQASKIGTNYMPLLLNPNGARVGIGTIAPTDTLSVNGTASKPGGGTWAVFSDERLKTIKGRYTPGLKAVMQLQPLRFEYKPDNALAIKLEGEQVGFSAQEVKKVIPEAVVQNANGYLMVNSDPIIWTMLNAIKEQQNAINEQQKQIVELKKQLRQLRGTKARRQR